MDVSRRRTLAGLGAFTAGLSGCVERGPGRTSTAVFVTNEAEEPQTVTLRLYELPAAVGESTDENSSGAAESTSDVETSELERVLARRDTLAPEAQITVSTEELPAADLRVALRASDGPSGSYDWVRADEFSSIDVRVGPSNVRFTELA